jgi:hypothetical protein
MLEKLKELVGDLGGYESDFLFIASMVSAFPEQLKLPSWTFVGLRSALDSYGVDPALRDLVRRCFGMNGRPIIGGSDEQADSRIDKAIMKLLAEREMEASFMFPQGLPDLSQGFLALPLEVKTRLIRFLMQGVFDSPPASFIVGGLPASPLIGMDAESHRYFLLKDSSLEVGLWRELSESGLVQLIATNTDAITTIVQSLRKAVSLPDRTRTTCVYCRKKVSSQPVVCVGCEIGSCHYSCLPARELTGCLWACSPDCHQMGLANALQTFVEEVEPLQKAEMRKRRRLQGELNSLRISSSGVEGDSSSRRTTRGRPTSSVDYSFRDYDRLMKDAIKKSERGMYYTSSEEEAPEVQRRPMSRDQRMALRESRQESVAQPIYMQEDSGDEEVSKPEPSVSYQGGFGAQSDELHDEAPVVANPVNEVSLVNSVPSDKLIAEQPIAALLNEPLHFTSNINSFEESH